MLPRLTVRVASQVLTDLRSIRSRVRTGLAALRSVRRGVSPCVLLLALTLGGPAVAVAQHVHEGSEASPQGGDPGTTQRHGMGEPLPSFIPPVTDADRAAAFPDVGDHTAHGASTHAFILFDHVEWESGGAHGLVVDAKGWVGGDLNRLWFRSHGARGGGKVRDAQLDLFYGRAVARWWDVVAGVRQDLEPGHERTWVALGLQGLAPYWFEVEATAYVGAGRTHLALAAEYELLLTNRLILQPAASLDIRGRRDPERGRGAGFSRIDAGLRLRYEIRREVAPYLGVVWDRDLGATAPLTREGGRPPGDGRVVFGTRFWF